MEDAETIADHRHALDTALRLNAEALAEGRTPPVGEGALQVLRHRIAVAPDVAGPAPIRRRRASPDPAPQVAMDDTFVPPTPIPSPIPTRGLPETATPTLLGMSGSPVVDGLEPLFDDLDLSPREQDVLRHLLSGRRTRELAAELFIGTETVKSHLKSIYRKLGVGSRAEAIAVVLRATHAGGEHDAPSSTASD